METLLNILLIIFVVVNTVCILVKRFGKNGKIKTTALIVSLTMFKYYAILAIYLMISFLLKYFFPNPKYDSLISFVITPIMVLCIMLKNKEKEVRKFKLKVLNKINERKYKD